MADGYGFGNNRITVIKACLVRDVKVDEREDNGT
jgi:hypothetical protein